MTVTRGRLRDPAKRSFFRTDEETLAPPGVRAPGVGAQAETGRSSDVLVATESPRMRPSLGPANDDDRKVRSAWSRGLLALWTVVIVSTFFEPAPNPHAVVPLWAGVLGFLFLTGMFTTVWGLSGNHSWGLKASLASATLGLGMAIACGVTDHHPAFWWGYETVAMTGILAFNRLALKKTSH